LLVTVDSQSGPAFRPEELGEVIGDSLGADEDDDLGVLFRDLVEVSDKLVSLAVGGSDLDVLGNVVVGRQLHGSNVDLNEVVLEVGSESLNLSRPGSREEQSLSIWSDLGDDLPDLGLETHIQHSVGLVHDEVGDSLEVGLAALEHVDQSTWGSDTDLDTSLEVSNLSTLWRTTVDSSVPDSRGFTELGALGLDLDGQLSGWGEDEDDWAVSWGEQWLCVDVNHGGKSESDSLSGTSLSDSDNVSSGQSHGPGLALNSGRSSEAGGSDLGEDVVGETSLVEGGDRPGNVLTLDGHRLGGSEVSDVLVGSSSHSRILNVEVLLELGEGLSVPVDSAEAVAKLAHSVTTTAAASVAAVAAA